MWIALQADTVAAAKKSGYSANCAGAGKEVDVLYEKLFEEKILGSLTEDRFKKLSYKYEDEQAELKQKIKRLKLLVAEEQTHGMNADCFLRLVRHYTHMQTLTPEIRHAFIDRVVVYHRENIHGETIQRVGTYYKMVGYIELPKMNRQDRESYM